MAPGAECLSVFLLLYSTNTELEKVASCRQVSPLSGSTVFSCRNETDESAVYLLVPIKLGEQMFRRRKMSWSRFIRG